MKKTSKAIAYNPEWTPEGTRERLRCVENASDGLRVVGYADELVRLNHTGWFTDPFGCESDSLARGAVLQLPARDGEPQYAPAIADPWNPDAYIVDFYSVTDDKSDAASWADSMAERHAERERDYLTQEAARLAVDDAREDVRKARAAARDIIHELRAVNAWRNVNAPAICAAVRRDLARHRATVRAAAQRIRTLTENPYSIVEG